MSLPTHFPCVQTEGCSGAELASLCQDAALLTMQENIDAPFVSYRSLITSRPFHRSVL